MIGTIIDIVRGGSGTCGTTSYMIQTDDVMPYIAFSINKKTFPYGEPQIGDKVIFETIHHNTAIKVEYVNNI